MVKCSAISRRIALKIIASAGLTAPSIVRAQSPIEVTDLLGRTVRLDHPAKRIVLGQGRHILALSILHPDPVSIVAAWGEDMIYGRSDEITAFRARFPDIDRIAPIGIRMIDDLAVEKSLAVEPDLVLLSRYAAGLAPAAKTSRIIETFEAAGIAVAVVDFAQSPLAETTRSMDIIGKLVGREAQARSFNAFYRAHIDGITNALSGLEDADRPMVMMQIAAGTRGCCLSPGHGAFNDFIRFSGGHNIGADILPGAMGQISLEQVLVSDIDIYIATGGAFAGTDTFRLGAGVTNTVARDSLNRTISMQNLDEVSAVRNGQVYGLWQTFSDSPTHILALEAMAKWFHPRRTAAIDPHATMNEINRRFLAVPFDGTYWTDEAAYGTTAADRK